MLTSVTLQGIIFMTKIRRGGFIFIAWASDHAPRHVHVYKEGRVVLRWDLENRRPITGSPSRGLLELIRILENEGLL